MKKAFYLPIAFLALAACTRSEVTQEVPEAIGFRPNALNTKALILPGSDENADFPPEQTFILKLSGLIGGNTFQNGKRYIFHIGISLDGANNEIMFSPTMDSWINEDINGITIDAVNNGLM